MGRKKKLFWFFFVFFYTSLSKKMKAKIVYHKECKSFLQFAKNNFSVALTFLHFLAFFVSLICKKWSINAQLTTDLSMYWYEKKNVPSDFTMNTLLSKEDLGSPYNNFSMVALNSHDIWVNFFGHFFCCPYMLENVVVQINCVAFHNTKKKQFKIWLCIQKQRSIFWT